ncbi:MAG: TIGR00730 family Rossman fold protein [bacterium]|nr:TIGR00730 family Rossman fold protein [bacterium]
MSEQRYICVYCGSSSGTRERYAAAAQALGEAIAARGYGLVYGGGGTGLMGSVADAVLQAGAPVLGVIPRALMARELGHRDVTELVVVDDMHQRKALMTSRATAFVAMPGGYGTLEELFEMVAWSQLEIHDRKIGLLNTAGYFDHLQAFLDHAVAEGFLQSRHHALLRVGTEPAALLAELLA